MKSKKCEAGVVSLIGNNRQEVKVCDIIDGKPKVKQIVKDSYIEFRLRYSLFHEEIRRYDKNTFERIL